MRTLRTLPLPLPLVRAAAALFLPTLLMGCKLDGEKIEKSIASELDKQGIQAKAACPRDVTEKKDGSFKCTVTLASSATAQVEVKMLGEGNVKWTFDPPKEGEETGGETKAP